MQRYEELAKGIHHADEVADHSGVLAEVVRGKEVLQGDGNYNDPAAHPGGHMAGKKAAAAVAKKMAEKEAAKAAGEDPSGRVSIISVRHITHPPIRRDRLY